MTRILVVTHKPLASLTNGHDLRVWHLCRELAKQHELYLLTVNLGSTDESSGGLVGLSDAVQEIVETPKFPIYRTTLKVHFRRNDSDYYSLSYPHHLSAITKSIADFCEEHSITHMIVFCLVLAEFVRPFSSDKKILFDLIDSEVLTLTRQIQFFPPWPA